MVQARNLMGSKKDVLPLSQGGPTSLQPVKQQRWLKALMPSQPCCHPFVTKGCRTRLSQPQKRDQPIASISNCSASAATDQLHNSYWCG